MKQKCDENLDKFRKIEKFGYFSKFNVSFIN